MRSVVVLLCASVASGCSTLQPPQGPCQLPDQTHTIGNQTWRSAGAQTWDDQAECLAQGGTFSTAANSLQQARIEHRASQGEASAIHQLGLWALQSDPPRYAQANTHFKTAWQLGHGESAWFLARMARYGQGQAPDPLEASNWMQRAAGDITLVAKLELDKAEIRGRHLTQTVENLRGELAKTRLSLNAIQIPKTRLFRFDLGGSGGCGTDLDWQAFGSSAMGLSLAMDAFERDYADQGWLWLDAERLSDPLQLQVIAEILERSDASIMASGLPEPEHSFGGERLYQAHADPGRSFRVGPNTLMWDCDAAS